jgi:hypothetical protein
MGSPPPPILTMKSRLQVICGGSLKVAGGSMIYQSVNPVPVDRRETFRGAPGL